MLSKYKLNQLYFKDTQFANLMTRRIFNVLLIANPYDAFIFITSLSAPFLAGINGGGGIGTTGKYVFRSGDLYAEYGR